MRPDASREPQAHQPGDREHDRIVLAAVELRDPGIDIAAQQADLDTGVALADLRFAPQAGRAHDRARRHLFQALEAVGNECIAGVLPRHDGGQDEPRGHLRRHVLHGMHGEVGAALKQRLLQLLHEQALAAGRVEAPVEELVATRGERKNFHL
jgi:hypothetical protein